MIIINSLFKSYKIKNAHSSNFFASFINIFSKRRVTVLSDINIRIKDNEKVAVIGLNGCGKTTLLKLIAGISVPDSGQIIVKGKIIPILQLGAGFQSDLSVKDNIFLNSAIFGMKRRDMQRNLNRILRFSELEAYENARLEDLSTGMKSRLSFAIALHCRPNTLLLDEVLAVGDIRFKIKCFKALDNVRKYPGSIVFVSHDLDIIKKYFDRCIYISEGIVAFDGSTSNALRMYLSDSENKKRTA